MGVRGGGQGVGVLEEAVVAGQGVGGCGVGAGGTGGLGEEDGRSRAPRLEERPRVEGGQMSSGKVGRISKEVVFSPTGQGRGVGLGKVQPGGVAGVEERSGLRVPSTPSADAPKGGTKGGEGGSPHAAQAMPGEVCPRGADQEGLEGEL